MPKPRKETESAEKFTPGQVSKIIEHNLSVGLLHLPPNFADDSSDESTGENEPEN